ncbi:MAG: FG-GAP repeat protein [Phycisphaerales bacterium]|nr:FG-GAP repeat protein [Phycisphaerales bacterium]
MKRWSPIHWVILLNCSLLFVVHDARGHAQCQVNELLKLTASDAETEDQFGHSIGVDTDVVVVGAPCEDDTGNDSGAAYVFERDEGGLNNWGQVAKLVASDAASKAAPLRAA